MQVKLNQDIAGTVCCAGEIYEARESPILSAALPGEAITVMLISAIGQPLGLADSSQFDVVPEGA